MSVLWKIADLLTKTLLRHKATDLSAATTSGSDGKISGCPTESRQRSALRIQM